MSVVATLPEQGARFVDRHKFQTTTTNGAKNSG